MWTEKEDAPKAFTASSTNTIQVRFMPEEKKKGKAEETAEKTGEVVGKGLKKGFGVVKGIGGGLKKGIKGEDKEKEKKSGLLAVFILPFFIRYSWRLRTMHASLPCFISQAFESL